MFEFEAIGTHWEIEIKDKGDRAKLDRLLADIKTRINIFDQNYSRFRSDSLVAEISRSADTYRLPADAEPMMNIYRELYDITGGKMTPLIGNLISSAGYDANYSLKEGGELRSPLPWPEVLEYNHPELRTEQPVLLDFGAAGKGYLIDIVGELILAAGIDEFLIDAGGDILVRGGHTEKIGLENPNDFKQIIGTVNLQNQSLCASAGSRRKWGRFHHIIDPHKLSSPVEILASWVIADSALLADALATALFFVSGNSLEEKYNFQYLVLRSDFSVNKSQNFPGELFTS